MRLILPLVLAFGPASGIAADHTGESLENASREAFVSAYDAMQRQRLEMLSLLLGRVESDMADFVDTETPLSDGERAAGGCLYDLMTERGDYDRLVAYVKSVSAETERLTEDESADYVTLMVDDAGQGAAAGVPDEIGIDVLRRCDALLSGARLNFPDGFWAEIYGRAIERGLSVTD